MRDIVWGGLLLPLRLYLQPGAFRKEVAALAPDLPGDYSLWQARKRLSDPAFRRGGALAFQSVVALLWAPLGTFVVLEMLLGLGYDVDWAQGAVGVAFGVAGGVAGGVASALTATHAITLPLHYLISMGSWVFVRLFPGLSPRLWRISPVRWDEVILPPLLGLAGLLVNLYHTHPALGQAALTEVAANRYQRRVAYTALARLTNEQASSVSSMSALVAFERGLDWLSEETPLPDTLQKPVFRMRDISREVASASKSDSATNRVRRLEVASHMLESLRLQPGEFGSALAGWSEIVTRGLEEARQQQRVEEPIPQVYISGRPIRPADRPETAVPFKGRKTLFRQLEIALGGTESQRDTLLLCGQRRTGKTSVLLHLPRRLGSQVVPAFLDLQSGNLGGAKDAIGVAKEELVQRLVMGVGHLALLAYGFQQRAPLLRRLGGSRHGQRIAGRRQFGVSGGQFASGGQGLGLEGRKTGGVCFGVDLAVERVQLLHQPGVGGSRERPAVNRLAWCAADHDLAELGHSLSPAVVQPGLAVVQCTVRDLGHNLAIDLDGLTTKLDSGVLHRVFMILKTKLVILQIPLIPSTRR